MSHSPKSNGNHTPHEVPPAIDANVVNDHDDAAEDDNSDDEQDVASYLKHAYPPSVLSNSTNSPPLQRQESIGSILTEIARTKLDDFNRPSFEKPQNIKHDRNQAQQEDLGVWTYIFAALTAVTCFASLHSWRLLPEDEKSLVTTVLIRGGVLLSVATVVSLVSLRLETYPILRIQLLIVTAAIFIYFERALVFILQYPLQSASSLVITLATGIGIYLFWYRKALSSFRSGGKHKPIVAPVLGGGRESSSEHRHRRHLKQQPADSDDNEQQTQQADDSESDSDDLAEPVPHPMWTDDDTDDEDVELSKAKRLQHLLKQLAHQRIDQLSKRFGSFRKISALANKHIPVSPERKPRRRNAPTLNVDTTVNYDADNDADSSPFLSLADSPRITGSSTSLHDELYFLSSKYISMSRENFEAMYDSLEWVVLPANKYVYQQGDLPDDGFYIIMDGEAVVLSDESRTLCKLQQGDSFGEIEMLFGWPRARSIRAVTSVTVMRINKQTFDTFTKERPDLYVSFIRTSLSRQWRIATFLLDEFLGISVQTNVNAPPTSPHQPPAHASSPLYNSLSSNPTSPTIPPSPAFSVGMSSFPGRQASQQSDRSYNSAQVTDSPPSHPLSHAGTRSTTPMPQYYASSNQLFTPDHPSQQRSAHKPHKSFSRTASSKALNRYSSEKLHNFLPADSPILHSLREQTSQASQQQQTTTPQPSPKIIDIPAGNVLYDEGSHVHDSLYLILEGKVVATRQIQQSGYKSRSGSPNKHPNASDTDDEIDSEIYHLTAGGLIGAVPFVTGCDQPYTCRSVTRCKLAVYTHTDLMAIPPSPVLVDMTKLVTEVMAPTLIQFASLGLKREWKRAGETLYTRGSKANDVFVVVHGRVRTIVGGKAGANNAARGALASARGMEARHRKGNDSNNDANSNDNGHNDTTFGYQLHDKASDNVRFEVGRGESVGEVQFLIDDGNSSDKSTSRHPSTAVCIRDTEVVRISKAAFQYMKHHYPQVMVRFSAVLAARLQQLLAQDAAASIPQSPFVSRKSSSLVITLMPHDSDVDVHTFGKALAASLNDHGRVMHITTATVDRVLGKETSHHLVEYQNRLRLTSWINEMEDRHRFLILEATPTTNEWTQCCCRVADCILVVADSRAPPAVPSHEHRLLWKQHRRRAAASTNSAGAPTVDTAQRTSSIPRQASSNQSRASSIGGKQSTSQSVNFCIKELVLLHPPTTQLPTGTRRWFAGRRLHSYHHIRTDLQAHYDRLARYLAGKSVGLVLSGGGARGLAHLGVVNALTEQHIPVDMIGGTSQGSFMAALYALQPEHSPNALVHGMSKRTADFSVKLGSIWELLRDATFPSMSYFDGYHFSESIRDLLGSKVQIEDLWIKYLCVTTNMSRADMCVHRQGVLWKAVRASMTILDYLPPMQISSATPDLLIDGGYTNNMPVDVMRYYYQPAKCIAVDVENKGDEDRLMNVHYWGSSLSGWWLTGRKLYGLINPFSQPLRVPKYTELVSSLVYINHNRTIRQLINGSLIDLYIRPELGTTQLLDYHKMQQIVEIGYRYSKPKITAWRINSHSELAFTRKQTVGKQQQQSGRGKDLFATDDAAVQSKNKSTNATPNKKTTPNRTNGTPAKSNGTSDSNQFLSAPNFGARSASVATVPLKSSSYEAEFQPTYTQADRSVPLRPQSPTNHTAFDTVLLERAISTPTQAAKWNAEEDDDSSQ